jgi:uncharacterized protein involved in exopolysaccharide biosynthesis
MSAPQAAEHLEGSPPNPVEGRGIDVLNFLLVLARGRRLIAVVTLAALLLGVALSLFLKPTFTATAIILPPREQQSSVSAMLGQLGKLREVAFHTTLLGLFAKEYGAARVDEANPAPLIQVVDQAVPSDRRSGSHRALLTLKLVFFWGFLGASVWVLFRPAWEQTTQIPENAYKLDQLRAVMRRGRLQSAAPAHSG